MSHLHMCTPFIYFRAAAFRRMEGMEVKSGQKHTKCLLELYLLVHKIKNNGLTVDEILF